MKQKRSKFTGDKPTAAQLSSMLLKTFAANPTKKYNARQLIEKLRIINPKDAVLHALKGLVEKDLIIHSKDDKFHWNKANIVTAASDAYETRTVVGEADVIKSGAAYVIVPNEEDDIYIPEKYVNGAMKGDTVKVHVFKIKNKKKAEGKIVEIVKRSLSHTIGTLRAFNQYGIVFPDLVNKFPEVLVKTSLFGGAKDGDKVVTEITQWGTERSRAIWGRVTKVLDEASENDIAMNSILISNGFEIDFEEEVLNEANMMHGNVSPFEEKIRRDFRGVTTFTIDPDTARDFDDALSYKEDLEKQTVEIGVHIADVTHFLKPNSALDKEAFNRSTSVYLVDRVCPMLPEKLSNDLCSLNPHEDKYTFSAVFTFDKNYKIIDRWFGKTIIHSNRRFTYEEAQIVLETKEGDYAHELETCNKIALKLRKDRFKNGSINFDSEEVKFILDENNKPIGVYVKERKDAHLLIEDFMLLANKEVAIFIHNKTKPEIPFIYRVHDQPDLAKLTDFALFAKEMGVQMRLDTPQNIAKSFNDLVAAKEKNPAVKMLEPLAIRTMAKAAYSSNNIGHYGLAFEYYSHFTSPIRRYSDVVAHRILYENLLDQPYRVDKEILEQRCQHISKQERKAMDCERDSVKYKQVEFMMDKVGKTFEGTISGMIEKGFFVEVLDVKAEGMIPFNKLSEPYTLHPSKLKATGRVSGNVLKMGDKVNVTLKNADLSLRQLEFILEED